MRRAFTLLEFLVVMAILALLIALTMPALTSARNVARRTLCGTNLRAIGQGSAVYAAEWNDQLPLVGGNASAIYWLWDISLGTGDMLSNSTEKATHDRPESVRRMFYCPSNSVQNDNNLWEFPSKENPTIRVIGYGWLGSRIGATQLGAIKPNARAAAGPFPPLEFHDHWSSTPKAALTELAFDAIISQPTFPPGDPVPVPANAANGPQFLDIVGGSPIHHCTSHLEKLQPTGQNILFFDGHVDWKKWLGTPHATPLVSGGANPPTFWVINP